MHSVRVPSQLLVSELFIAVPTNTEIPKYFFNTCNIVHLIIGCPFTIFDNVSHERELVSYVCI